LPHFGRICIAVDDAEHAWELSKMNMVIKRSFSQGGNQVFLPGTEGNRLPNVKDFREFMRAWEAARRELGNRKGPLFYAEPHNPNFHNRGEVRIFYINKVRFKRAVHSILKSSSRKGFHYEDQEFLGAQDIRTVAHV
jgi:hypothetical protein